MSTLPASGYISSNARTEGEDKQFLEDLRDVMAESLGGAAETLLTISAGSVTATSAAHRIDTEASASADDLANIVQTNHPDGRLLIIRVENAARVVTVKNAAGGAGQILTQDGNDIVLNDVEIYVILRRDGTSWQVIFVSSGAALAATSGNSNMFTGVDVLSVTGNYIVPAGVFKARALIVGAAGGGATGPDSANPGGGGGSGGLTETFIDTTPGASIAYVIGAGGAGGASGGNPGSDGAISTFDGISASKGGGGFAGTTVPGLGGRDKGGGSGGDIASPGGEGRRGEASTIGGTGGKILHSVPGLGGFGGNGVAGARGGGGGGSATGAGGAGGNGAIYIYR